MAKQFQVVKVAIEIHEDNWNDDLQVLVYNGDTIITKIWK